LETSEKINKNGTMKSASTTTKMKGAQSWPDSTRKLFTQYDTSTCHMTTLTVLLMLQT